MKRKFLSLRKWSHHIMYNDCVDTHTAHTSQIKWIFFKRNLTLWVCSLWFEIVNGMFGWFRRTFASRATAFTHWIFRATMRRCINTMLRRIWRMIDQSMVSHPSIVLRKHLSHFAQSTHRCIVRLEWIECIFTSEKRNFLWRQRQGVSMAVAMMRPVAVWTCANGSWCVYHFVNFVSVFFATFDPKLFDSHIDESIRSDKVNFQLQFGRFEMCERI